MADAVSSIGSTTAGSATKVAATSSSSTTQVTTPIQDQRASPHLSYDPIAGVVISEYFDSGGDVQTQIPSAASVAYLRMGIASAGSSVLQTNSTQPEPGQQQNEVLA